MPVPAALAERKPAAGRAADAQASSASSTLRAASYAEAQTALRPRAPAPDVAGAPVGAGAPEAKVGPNAILADLQTTGASLSTARGQGYRRGGVATSVAMAEADSGRLDDLRPIFEKVAAEFDLPPAILMGIASRETRGGTQLNAEGYSRWDGQGFGIMQVDKNSHTPQGSARGIEHIRQAAGILAGFRDRMRARYPDASPAELLRLAVAAYNCGPGNVRSAATPDRRTTGKDYSSDVWARAQWYATQDQRDPAAPAPDGNMG